MTELKTLTGEDIETTTRGILYLCELTETKLKVHRAIQFERSFDALNAYANIPNPESQLVYCKDGEGFDDLIKSNEILKKNIVDPKWIEQLHDTI